MIDIFRKEQNNILTDLAVASADARKKEDEKNSKQLSKLLEDYDDFDAEIKTQKAHLNEIDAQIRRVKKKVNYLQTDVLNNFCFQVLKYFRY